MIANTQVVYMDITICAIYDVPKKVMVGPLHNGAYLNKIEENWIEYKYNIFKIHF